MTMNFRPEIWSLSKIKKAFEDGRLIVIDVRTSWEFVHGHIEKSCNLPNEELPRFIDEIKAWDKRIITCSSNGFRSKRAANLLQSNQILTIDGGDWRKLNELLNDQTTKS